MRILIKPVAMAILILVTLVQRRMRARRAIVGTARAAKQPVKTGRVPALGEGPLRFEQVDWWSPPDVAHVRRGPVHVRGRVERGADGSLKLADDSGALPLVVSDVLAPGTSIELWGVARGGPDDPDDRGELHIDARTDPPYGYERVVDRAERGQLAIVEPTDRGALSLAEESDGLALVDEPVPAGSKRQAR